LNFSIGNLHFSPTPLTLALGIIALLGMGWLCWTAWRRATRPRRTGMLELLRYTVTVVVVLLLWKPEWLTRTSVNTRPEIVILRDASRSMTTEDAVLPNSGGAPRVVSRKEWTDLLLADPAWASLDNKGRNTVIQAAFDTPPEDPTAAALSGTNLHKALADPLERGRNVKAMIVISDGDWNLGQPPVAAAQQLRLRGIPLYTVTAGSNVRLPDLDLRSVTAPTYGIVGENVQIPFSIRSSLDHEVRTVVRLRDGNGTERTKDVTLAPGIEYFDSILWRLEKEGASTLELSLPVAEGELVETNNSRRFNIAGRRESIKVLVVETTPRWEYRFIRNALSRDPGVDLDTLLLHPDLGAGAGPDYLQDFPSKPEDLAKYDVIFIGDIGIGQDMLTTEQAESIRGLVENQASGLVIIPGSQGNIFSLMDSPLGDLIPVILDPEKKEGIAESTPSPLALTTEGRTSLLTMLGNTEEENPLIWRSLPGFYWHAPVLKASGGAEVLAVHANRRNAFGRIPVIVTRPAGSGKVLFMGIDSAWRWRRGVEDLYHYRFWGQVARWMSYQRNMAAGERVRLYYTPERPEPGDTVRISANAFDPNGAPLNEGKVLVDLTSPDGRAERIELKHAEGAWGAYSGQFRIDLPGEWKISGFAEGAEERRTDTSLIAQGTEVEKVGEPARPEVLAELARVARGTVIDPSNLAQLVRDVSALPEPRPVELRHPLWSHWATAASLIFLLGIFWTGRKLNGTF
jgi:hypothetical protein